MFSTAYDTLAARFYDVKEIRSKLELARIDDELKPARWPDSREIIDGIYEVGDNEVPTFTHPFKYEFDKKPVYVVDLRPYTKIERDGTRAITNLPEYSLLLMRAKLNKIWDEEPSLVVNMGDLPMVVFVRWLTGVISSRLGLSPEDQIKLSAVTLFYWYDLSREESLEESEKMRVLAKLSKISYIPTTAVVGLVDRIVRMGNVSDYIAVAKEVVGSTRMEKLNPGLLFSMLGGSWFGLNAKELIAVATEHPPTFIAIINAALESRSYKKSLLGKLVYENDKDRRGKVFTQSIYNLMKDY
ncbi:MAG: hypothetical protein IBX57_00025 [Gammaproteobacteria bacterium]|nr:hypothetical protein [Gammaproteobacteria bacterium]